MLTVAEIQQALHASRVMSLPPGAYHGPLGLEHLTAAPQRRAIRATSFSARPAPARRTHVLRDVQSAGLGLL